MKCKHKRHYYLWMVLTVLLLFCCSRTAVYAETQEYSIPNADFIAVVNSDGTVDITETWTVSYDSGEFTRFYKDWLQDGLKEDESFQIDLSSLKVFIDGVECEYTDDTNGRPDFHYYAAKNNDGYTVNCYLKSKNVTRTYVINYTVYNAVKHVQSDDFYVFSFRYIGANFSKARENTKVKVFAPQGAKAAVLYASDASDNYSDENYVEVESGHNFGMFKVKV